MDTHRSGSGPSGSFEPIDVATLEVLYLQSGGAIQEKLIQLNGDLAKRDRKPALFNGRVFLYVTGEHMKSNDFGGGLLASETLSGVIVYNDGFKMCAQQFGNVLDELPAHIVTRNSEIRTKMFVLPYFKKFIRSIGVPAENTL